MSGGAPRGLARPSDDEDARTPDAGPHDKASVEDRPNVGTTTPDAYPKDGDAGPGSGGGGKPDYGSAKR